MLERLFGLTAAGTTLRAETVAGAEPDRLGYVFAALFLVRYALSD